MFAAAIVWAGLATVGAGDFLRPFGEKVFEQATLDAEGFGGKPALGREAEGLRLALKPGEAEAGWKTPNGLRFGGDCAIVATLVVRKLPKPARDDGAAVGIAVATQSVDQPDATLLREIEPDGRDVYRPFDKGSAGGPQGGPMMMNMGRRMIVFNGPGNAGAAKPTKPERHTFPAKGEAIRLEFRRKGPTLRCEVFDAMATEPREVGRFEIGTGDIAGFKVFVSNRNGSGPIEVLLRDVTIHADRLTGLGTTVRRIDGTVVHGEPTAIEGATLVVGGPAPTADPKAGQPATPANAPPSTAVTASAKVAAPGPTAVASPAKPPSASTKPKALIPLDEVESITFERASTLTARYLGQPNVDATGPGATPDPGAAKAPAADDLSAPPPGTVAPPKVVKAEAKPNGIRDIHLALSGLRDAAFQQFTIQCPTDKGQGSWKLDPVGSPEAPIALRRAGNETWADVYLEPPPGDCNGKEFVVAITYADGQNARAQVKATGPTDPKLAFDPAAPTSPLDARVYLTGDEQLFGKLDAIGDDALALTLPWGDRVDVPLARVAGVYMGMTDHKESPDSFAKRLKSRGRDDLLLARSKDGEVVAIGGIVEAAKAGKLRFNYGGKPRTLPLKGVEGFVLADRPGPGPPGEVRPTFAMAGGVALSGKWTAFGATHWTVELPWGQSLKLPAADVRAVRFRGTRLAYLSDLTPARVDEAGYFGRTLAYRKDVNLDGGPLRIGDRSFEKGLAVHARSDLTYDLGRTYDTFEALVGFDDAGGGRGRVDLRVLADGKEIYANPDLRADAPPVRLALPVSGADRLRLVVDFGADEDTGDRLIWADARLVRRAPAPANTPTPSRP